MPTYVYECPKCQKSFDVTKSVHDYDSEERCEACICPAVRTISRVNFANAGDWKPTFNPAFGQVVRSKAHQREILAKFRGEGKEFIEVGNEPVEKIHKKFDTQRAETREKRWEESTEKIISEVLN